ncbi:MAG: hypothetical protein LBT82_02915 [Oscillospiraceae bacterium]|jgi:hypothetical protein|nr:hypothetical protein [Oscillospiraceae bacterium]
MDSDSVCDFYDFLRRSPNLLNEIKQKQKKYNNIEDEEYKFVKEVVVPLAKKVGYDLNFKDFIEFENSKLNEEDLENISGGVNVRRAFATLGMLLMGSSVVGSVVYKSGVHEKILPVISAKNFKGTLREKTDSEKDYDNMIKKEVEEKNKAKKEGTYSKKKEEKSNKYGYGNFENQKGLLTFSKGEDVRLNDPELKFSQVDSQSGFKAEEHKYNLAAPLFRHSPSVHDIRQGGIGNCYFESSLIAFLSTSDGQQKILESMYDNEDGTVTVRLFNNDGKERYFTINKSIPKIKDAEGVLKIINTKDHVIWPSLFFKAYVAALNQEDFSSFKGALSKNKTNITYEDCESGNPDEVFKCVFGYKNTEYLETKTATENQSSEEYSREEMRIFGRIKNTLESKKPACCGTKADSTKIKKGLNKSHAYALVNVEKVDEKYFVYLTDPWRDKAEMGDSLEKWEDASGLFRMELKEFLNSFESVNLAK